MFNHLTTKFLKTSIFHNGFSAVKVKSSDNISDSNIEVRQNVSQLEF